MVVTKILRKPRERDTFDIYLDDRLAFTVSGEVLTRSGLHRGMQLDEKECTSLASAATMDRARKIAVNFISYRPRSSKEIIDKLTRKGFTSEIANDVARHLREVSMINDLDFARLLVRDKLRGKPMGRAMIRRKLVEKGIAFQIIERVLKEYVSEEDEEEAAAKLAAKKLKLSRSRFAGLDAARRRKRLMDYLLGRGFSTEVAIKTVRHVI